MGVGGPIEDAHPRRGRQGAPSSFGARLRALRERAGLSQAALAERAGLGVATLAALEHDQRPRPHPHTLATLAEALGLGPAARTALLEAARTAGPRAPAVAVAGRPRAARGPSGRGRHNLPSGLSPLIGRQRERADLLGLLATARLVTLTGSGGVGKTRLALEVAAAALPAYPDGVWLASLAALTDPALVAHAVAAAVGVPEQGHRPLAATLGEALRPRRALLVLDNCEHLVQACAELAEVLLGAGPDLRILATSQEPLGLAGEVTWRVPSLGLPAPPPPPPDQLSQYAAVNLFIERAVAARPDFQVTNANAPAVAEVCARLDGIPLAIELAAAWVRALSVEQLAARLDDRLGLLVGGSRTAPPRQQTLRGAIEWSYGLLTEAERHLFARLSVFAGGWPLEAAETVCAAEGIATPEILGLLRQLVDKSLVVADELPEGSRYRLLETLRAYARERAQAAGESRALERRHRDWCLALAEASPPELLDPRHVARLAQEQDNFRTALRGCIERGEAEAGLRLGVALWPLWFVRGLYTEGQAWLDELLGLPDAAPPTAARARALAWAGHLAYCRSDYVAAGARLDAALATARRVHDDAGVGVALLFLGHVARVHGDLERAEERYLLARQTHRRVGNPAWEAVAVSNHALLLEERGDVARAQALGTEGLTLARAAGHPNAESRMLGLLGRLAFERGDHQEARRRLEESLELQREQGYQQGLAWTLLSLARVAHAEGDDAEAGRVLVECLRRARDAGDRLALARGMEEVAALVAADQPARAVRLAGASEALRHAVGADPLPAERDRLASWQATARVVLGESGYAAAWAEGQHHTPEQATSLALELADAAGARRRDRVATVGKDPLTPREREVAMLLARGLTNRQVGEALVISEGTARIHAEHVLGKLGLRSRVQVAAWARQHGQLAEPDA